MLIRDFINLFWRIFEDKISVFVQTDIEKFCLSIILWSPFTFVPALYTFCGVSSVENAKMLIFSVSVPIVVGTSLIVSNPRVERSSAVHFLLFNSFSMLIILTFSCI